MCLYQNHQGTEMIIVGVYVDDLLVTASLADLVGDSFDAMRTLSIKDLGEVRKFLGMRVELSDKDGNTQAQQAAIEELLQQHGLADANDVRSPIRDENYDEELDQKVFLGERNGRSDPTVRDLQSVVGSLLWVARCTRPDISFAVHRSTRYTHQPTMRDWKLAKRIARYLKFTKEVKLRMAVNVAEGKHVKLESWSDADFAAGKRDEKSLTHGVITMDGAVIHWMCKKQTGVSLSTLEAKFISVERLT
uniref:Uncharacterized protein AlNc14C43G3601 n=1 Tax=Albugo laibachii Nc14 TaxID=890382 RepID=F0WA57_9STRA|nr:PREDICTED: hypothetical protein [Albugo laibachii Nc14]|eukprot:CCA18027.1 PREDICTED: hypothetical protein [Albugo laibachii Nc14]